MIKKSQIETKLFPVFNNKKTEVCSTLIVKSTIISDISPLETGVIASAQISATEKVTQEQIHQVLYGEVALYIQFVRRELAEAQVELHRFPHQEAEFVSKKLIEVHDRLVELQQILSTPSDHGCVYRPR